MARIENTTPAAKDLHDTVKGPDGRDLPGNTGKCFTIPRGSYGGGEPPFNGVAEVPDDVLDRLLKNDTFTKALFDTGALVVKSAPKAAPVVETRTDDGTGGKGGRGK